MLAIWPVKRIEHTSTKTTICSELNSKIKYGDKGKIGQYFYCLGVG